MADDLPKFDIEAFVRWIDAVRRPFSTMAEILAHGEEHKQLAGAFQLWIVSAILSTAVASVMGGMVLQTHVDLRDTLYYFAFGMLFFLLTVLVLHWSLKLLGIASDFCKTAVLQSVLVCYSPITMVFLVPFLLKSWTKGFGSPVPIMEPSTACWIYGREYRELLSAILRFDSWPGLRYLGWCGPVLSTILLALLAEAVCKFYGAPKLRAQLAIIVGSLLGVAVPVALFTAAITR